MNKLESYINQLGFTKYSFSKKSGVPWSTLCALLDGRSNINNFSFGNAMKICKTLKIKMEELYELCQQEIPEEHRSSFELFKSNICHDVKREGDIAFIEKTIHSNVIREYYNKKWFPECLYMLAMIDYLSRVNEIELDSSYDDLRQLKLNKPIFPTSTYVSYVFNNDTSFVAESFNEAIPEFLNFNIVEGDIRDVK